MVLQLSSPACEYLCEVDDVNCQREADRVALDPLDFYSSLVAIIPELVSAFAYTAIIFPGTGMRTTARIFFEDTVCIWAQLSFGESLGIMVASLFDTEGLSVSIISVSSRPAFKHDDSQQ